MNIKFINFFPFLVVQSVTLAPLRFIPSPTHPPTEEIEKEPKKGKTILKTFMCVMQISSIPHSFLPSFYGKTSPRSCRQSVPRRAFDWL